MSTLVDEYIKCLVCNTKIQYYSIEDKYIIFHCPKCGFEMKFYRVSYDEVIEAI